MKGLLALEPQLRAVECVAINVRGQVVSLPLIEAVAKQWCGSALGIAEPGFRGARHPWLLTAAKGAAPYGDGGGGAAQ